MSLKEANKLFNKNKNLTNQCLNRSNLEKKITNNEYEEKTFYFLLFMMSIAIFSYLDFITKDYFYKNGYWVHFGIGITFISSIVLFLKMKYIRKCNRRQNRFSKKIIELTEKKETTISKYNKLISKNVDLYFDEIKKMNKNEISLFSEEVINEIITMKKNALQKERDLSHNLKKTIELEEEMLNQDEKMGISNI